MKANIMILDIKTEVDGALTSQLNQPKDLRTKYISSRKSFSVERIMSKLEMFGRNCACVIVGCRKHPDLLSMYVITNNSRNQKEAAVHRNLVESHADYSTHTLISSQYR